MLDIELIRDIDYPAEKVWSVLEDFGNMAWTGALRVEVIGEGVGMTRRVMVEGMEPIDEVLESMDTANMTFTYTIPRGMPLPVTDYRAGARVERLDGGAARVIWSCTCNSADPNLNEKDVQGLLKDAYSGMLDGLEAHLGNT